MIDKKNSHLLGIHFESWIFSEKTKTRNLSIQKLRELDNGYSLESLDFLLKLLRKYNQKVTFFLIFKLEDIYPGTIERIVNEGHEVGWHSHTHAKLTNKKNLLKELNESKKYLIKYGVKGFQAPKILFFKDGYRILKDYGFSYSTSIYGNSNNVYNFDGIYEIPVSTSRNSYNPPQEKIVFPSRINLSNIIKFGIPFGSGYFFSLLNKPYYAKKLKWYTKNKKRANLFIHNWQLILPKSNSSYYKNDIKEKNFLSNLIFSPYTVNVQKLFEFLLKNFAFKSFKDYVEYDLKYMSKQDDKTLKDMFAEFKKSSRIFHPSNFWVKLNKLHVNQLSTAGFKNFKRTVSYHYFGWGILSIIRHQLSPLFGELKKGNFAPVLYSRFKINSPKPQNSLRKFHPLSAIIYRIFVSSLMEYVSKIDKLNILKKLEEPLIGNPFIVYYKNKPISQDICNSIHEFYSITQKISLPKNARIVDLGAGYGRLAYIFLNIIPDSSYCIVDIPPALFVSQNYLKMIFPKEKIFLFRSFTSFKEIKSEFESCRIKFLLPHQLELLPKKYFDLFINVSSFHEMTRPQINKYIQIIDRSCRGYFYTKQWLKSETKDNSNIKEDEYPIPENWKEITRNSPHPIQKLFFDALYKIT